MSIVARITYPDAPTRSVPVAWRMPTATSGTMTTPPICWPTRGSLTRAEMSTPATVDTSPIAGPSRNTPASQEASVTTRNSCGPYTADASAMNTA